MKEWYAPHEIIFSREQCLFLILNITLLREGRYPPECTPTGYTGGNNNIGHHAPFETPALFAAEMDYRLSKCGKDGLLLEAQVMASCPLHKDSKLALKYVSGYKRKQMGYLEWARQYRYRKKESLRW